ncbi:DUF4255 domain-containing protein [Streptosporangiaceae bacterium NEAU-GS5]|nr:DUF4255 domain-containing protein [Streptosporangiaceae bacterium NEAU-GS5]
MSNYLAVAMVTSALGRILNEAFAAELPGGVRHARVTTQRPHTLGTADSDAAGVNLFLYRVLSNGALSVAELPTRHADGSLINPPRQALDLHYLLTFSGEETALEPQRLLGLVVSTLAVQPVLTRGTIAATMDDAVTVDPTAWEQYSDLAVQPESVRVTLLPLDLEELTKLWSLFSHAPYRLSVAYRAAAVLLDGPGTSAPPAPPVRRHFIEARPAVPVPAVRPEPHARSESGAESESESGVREGR